MSLSIEKAVLALCLCFHICIYKDANHPVNEELTRSDTPPHSYHKLSKKVSTVLYEVFKFWKLFKCTEVSGETRCTTGLQEATSQPFFYVTDLRWFVEKHQNIPSSLTK